MRANAYTQRRLELESRIEEMIELLDILDGDPDLEDDEIEHENEHGGDILDVPHDQADEGNDEPSLGWSNPMGVRVEDMPLGWSCADSEGWSRDDLLGGTGQLGFTGEGHVAADKELRERGMVTYWRPAPSLSPGLPDPGPMLLRIAR